MKRKLISILLCSAMLLSMVACGKKEVADTETGSQISKTESEQGTEVVSESESSGNSEVTTEEVTTPETESEEPAPLESEVPEETEPVENENNGGGADNNTNSNNNNGGNANNGGGSGNGNTPNSGAGSGNNNSNSGSNSSSEPQPTPSRYETINGFTIDYSTYNNRPDLEQDVKTLCAAGYYKIVDYPDGGCGMLLKDGDESDWGFEQLAAHIKSLGYEAGNMSGGYFHGTGAYLVECFDYRPLVIDPLEGKYESEEI